MKEQLEYVKEQVKETLGRDTIRAGQNCIIKEIDQNELMNKKHKKNCTTLNYIEHSPISASVVTWCISISAFASLQGTVSAL